MNRRDLFQRLLAGAVAPLLPVSVLRIFEQPVSPIALPEWGIPLIGWDLTHHHEPTRLESVYPPFVEYRSGRQWDSMRATAELTSETLRIADGLFRNSEPAAIVVPNYGGGGIVVRGRITSLVLNSGNLTEQSTADIEIAFADNVRVIENMQTGFIGRMGAAGDALGVVA